MVGRTRVLLAILALGVLPGAGTTADAFPQDPPAPAPDPTQQVPAEPGVETPAEMPLEVARAAFDAGRYEEAGAVLDALITSVGPLVSDPADRALLASSYALRALTRVRLKDAEGARSDFRAMLLLDPSAVLPPDVNGRAQALFDEARATTIGEVVVLVYPPDASVALDGVPLPDVPSMLVLPGGTHTLAASRKGYRDRSQTFTVVPGRPAEPITLYLDREFSTLSFRTSPPGVEVVIDGMPQGTTEPDPAQPSPDEEAVSAPFTIEQLLPGPHRLELRRDCHVGVTRDLQVTRPDDLSLDVVRLQPAVATVTVTSDAAGATVLVDGVPRGTAPIALNDVCEGPRVIEVRTPSGRHLERLELSTGQKVAVEARVRPAFALVQAGVPEAAPAGEDLRPIVEREFRSASTVTLFVPSEGAVPDASAAGLPRDWLAFDLLGRPFGGATRVSDEERRQAGISMAKALGAQGVAAIVPDPAGAPSDRLLVLLAAGSVRPDVLPWRADSPTSIRQAIARLEAQPVMIRASLGMVAVDVLDVAGVVVAAVEPDAPAAVAGIAPGEVIVSAGGSAVTGGVQLVGLIDRHPAGTPLSLEVVDRTGASRLVDVVPVRIPRVALFDRTTMSNALAAHLAHRVEAAAPERLEEMALRLNLAGALMRLEHWQAAASELERVVTLVTETGLAAPVQRAVTGTAHYMLGLCAESLGDAEGAARAWAEAARTGGSMLTDSAEPIAVLAGRQRARVEEGRAEEPRP